MIKKANPYGNLPIPFRTESDRMYKGPENDIRALSAAIAERLRRNDEQALEIVLDRFGGSVRSRLATRFGMVMDELELDDALSRALFQLWRYRDRYDPQRSSLATWFYLLARTAAFDLLRERADWEQAESAVGSPAEECPVGPEEQEELGRPAGPNIRIERLRELLEKMSALDRRILLAFAEAEGEGNWAAALATELRMPAATIRSRKLRALAQIRESFLATTAAESEGGNIVQSFSTHQPVDPEIAQVALKLRDFFKRFREPLLRGDGLLNFQATWAKAVRDGSINDEHRRRILTQTFRWLRGRASQQEEYHEQLRGFYDRCMKHKDAPLLTLTRNSPEEGVRRLELGLAGVSSEIEREMPDDVVRDGQGEVILSWSNDDRDAKVTWQGVDNGSTLHPVDLRGAAMHSFAAYARLPDPEVTFFSDRLVEEVAGHQLTLPNFLDLSGATAEQVPKVLHWQPSEPVYESEAGLPEWIRELKEPPGPLPTESEQRLYETDPTTAERFEKLLCDAALVNLRTLQTQEPGSGSEAPVDAVALLIEDVAREAGRSREEIAELGGETLGHLNQPGTETCAKKVAAMEFLCRYINAH